MARPARNGWKSVNDPEAVSNDDKMDSTENNDRKLTRRLNKPLMERKRRQRINVCLDELKTILMDVTKKETSFYSKLEKADILEMTVKYMNSIRKNNSKCSPNADERSRYISGFNECIREITTYLSSAEGLDEDARTSILGYIHNTLPKTQSPAGPLTVHGYESNHLSDFALVLPYIETYQPVAPCSMTSHSESSGPQEVKGRSQVTSLPKDRASFQENGSDVVSASTKSQIDEVSLPPISNFCLRKQNSFNNGKTVAQANVPMKVVPACLVSGKRILFLTGPQTTTLSPIMPCAGSWIVNSQATSKPNIETGNRESMGPSFVVASSDSCAVLGNVEPRADDTNKPESETTCEVFAVIKERQKIISTGSAFISDRCRITGSDDVIASPHTAIVSNPADGNDWGNRRNKPEVEELETSSDVWRPW